MRHAPAPTAAAPVRTFAILCAFIFLLSFKPCEPHLTRYLRSKGLSDFEINNEVYPVWTYSYLPLLLLGGLLSELLGYVPVIVAGSVARLGTRAVLLWGSSLRWMQASQVLYATGSVAEVVFFSYTFQVVPAAWQQRAASVTQAAYLVAHVASSLLGDALTQWVGVPLHHLLYISGTCVALATCVACAAFAPLHAAAAPAPVAGSRVAHLRASCTVAWKALQRGGFVVLAAWWVVGNAVYQTVYGYETSIYDHFHSASRGDFNGSVLAIALLLGSAAALLPSVRAWEATLARREPVVAAATALVCGGLLAMLAWAPMAPALAGFVLYFCVWQFVVTALYGGVARSVRRPSVRADTSAASLHVVPVPGSVQSDVALLDDVRRHSDAEVAQSGAAEWEIASLRAQRTRGEAEDAAAGTQQRPYAALLALLTAASLSLQTVMQAVLFNVLQLDIMRVCRVYAWATAGCVPALALLELWRRRRARK